MLDFYNISLRKANKEHICELCGEKIKVGEQYKRNSGKFDGEFYDISLHLFCDGIVNDYCTEIGEDSWDYDGVHDWVYERVCYDCKHSCHNDGFDDCEYDRNIFECPEIRRIFSHKKKRERT